MIIGIGTDIIAIGRVSKAVDNYGERFINRCFTASEIEESKKLKGNNNRIRYFSKRWAAKEALAKAAGTGIGKYIGFQNIDVSERSNMGQPIITVTGEAMKYIENLSGGSNFKLDISLSDEKGFAIAFVVISILCNCN